MLEKEKSVHFCEEKENDVGVMTGLDTASLNGATEDMQAKRGTDEEGCRGNCVLSKM